VAFRLIDTNIVSYILNRHSLAAVYQGSVLEIIYRDAG